jgi:tRNA A-37 threonylcarbamoyl transferase component Bud32
MSEKSAAAENLEDPSGTLAPRVGDRTLSSSGAYGSSSSSTGIQPVQARAAARTPAAYDATQPAVGALSPMPGHTPTPLPVSADRWSGQVVDHFRIISELGRGGMGTVYRAVDLSLDRPVAIKVLPDQVVGNAALEDRFRREARAQARLSSPNVVPIYFIGELPAPEGRRGSLYFAMELVDGETFEDVLTRGETLTAEEARVAMLHVARGLRDAQRAGIIHRDVKPSNLIRDRSGWVKIVDFGIAKPLGEGNAITQDGAVLGTPLYMAPEQARGEAVDHRADMYAMGCTFFHLLAGAPPFDGATPFVIVARHMTEPAADVRGLSPHVPASIATIVKRLMEKAPADRYADYDELVHELEAAAPERVRYAGFGARAAGNMIDLVIAGLSVAALGWIGAAIHLVHVTVGQAYFGQTVGKYVMNVRIQRPGGAPLGLARSLLRVVASLWLIVYFGAVILVTKGPSNARHALEMMQPKEAPHLQHMLIAMMIGNGVLTLLYLAGLGLGMLDGRRRTFHDLASGAEAVYRLRDETVVELARSATRKLTAKVLTPRP